MQEHDALPGREQVMQPAGHDRIGPDRTGRTAALQSEAGQVMAQDRVERSPMLGPEPLLRGGLHGMRERPGPLGADRGQHAGERVEVDPVPAGDGE